VSGAEGGGPGRRGLAALAWGLLALSAAVGSTLWLQAWLGHFDAVRSSTGAWILAHVDLVQRVGDYKAAAAVSLVPNTTYNPLYPGLLTVSGQVGTPLVVAAHRLAAAAVGICGVALALFWSRAGGGLVGLAAAVAVLFPPLLASGGLVRPDTLAVALSLLSVAAAARARSEGGAAWFLGGVLAGLTYLAREFTVGPALGALSVAWLLAAWRDRRLEPVLGSALLVVLGVAAGALPLPLSLGLSPWGGLDALLGYGRTGHAGAAADSAAALLYLDVMPIPLALALLGWVLALLRGRDRGAVLVGLGALLPFAAFLLSAQQSPQYYLLGHVLFLSGIAGLGLLWRRWPVQLVLAGVLLALALPSARALTPRLVQADRNRHPRIHTEGWPCGPDEPAEIIDRAMEWVGDRPLLVSSGRVENIDALVPLRHHRPAAFVFANWQDRVPEIVSLYDGEPVYYLSVEGRTDGHPLPDGAVVVDQWESAELSAVLALVSGRDAPPGVDLCENGGPVRGACVQRAWLQLGDEGLPARVRARGAEFQQRLTASTRWW